MVSQNVAFQELLCSCDGDVAGRDSAPPKRLFTWLDMAMAKTEEERLAIEKQLEIQAVEAHRQGPIIHAQQQAEDDARLRATLLAEGYVRQ